MGTHNYLVLRERHIKRGRCMEIVPGTTPEEIDRVLRDIGRFVISSMESIHNDPELDGWDVNDVEIEIYLSPMDETEHEEMRQLIEDTDAIERLIASDPRTYFS